MKSGIIQIDERTIPADQEFPKILNTLCVKWLVKMNGAMNGFGAN